MKNRWMEVAPDADEKQEKKFASLLEAKDIPFVDDTARNDYVKRVNMIKDAIQLKKKPERVPICPAIGFFPIQYSGNTFFEAHYDYEKLVESWDKYHLDFEPDAYYSPMSLVAGKALDILDYKLYKWAGRGVADDKTFQYIEDEYMKADEYQDLIDDPTGFMLNIYFPRIAGSLGALKKLPLFPAQNELPLLPGGMLPFGQPDVQEALTKLMGAGKEIAEWLGILRQLNLKGMGRGFPSMYGGFSKAPFDAIGDTLRGTMGVLMDIYKHPDELLEACERITPFMIKQAIAACNTSGNPLVFMPLHKGADSFMSSDQYQKFYWPTLKKVIIGMVNEGLVHIIFA